MEVRCYGGEVLTRRVASDRGRTVIVCNEAEYRKASQAGREPDGIGFPVRQCKPIMGPRKLYEAA